MVGNLQNIFMELDLYLIIFLTHRMYFFAFATNIPVRHVTGFVIQGHILFILMIENEIHLDGL